MHPLETYLNDVREIRASGAGVAETSYYPPLAALLNEIGKTLKPKVRCVMNLANRGAGMPDGGLFTADQIKKDVHTRMVGQAPARGAIEAKGPKHKAQDIVDSEQVARYVREYGTVLVTNLREFVLVGTSESGVPVALERYTLADTEPAFWQLCAHPLNSVKVHGDRFTEYLRRVMLFNAPLTEPQDVAWFLASYARDAKARVEAGPDLTALTSVRTALEEALGMKFTGEKGDHFFRSTLVQTIFYGVFSAWVLWHRERTGRTDEFNWRQAEWSLRVPFIRTLYEQVATSSKLNPLNLVEVLDWAAAALNRVDRAAFFRKFQDEHAVQYFYEPFLQAFDPELRKELGVWYTPTEIVQYQVARVDTVLREELGLADGLADESVIVLDPCCGTGAYLVETLKHIATTLKAKGGDALLASDLKRAAMSRVFGFEILPAPFVVAHLQLGLILHGLGAPLAAQSSERVGVYLTNALTGWDPPKDPKDLLFPELEAERDAADDVKRNKKILVVLGNPPYNAFAGVSPEEEQGLVDPYKEKLNTPVAAGGWGIKKFNLDDLYIRFFRLAERRIAEMSGLGVVSFISSFSYLSDPSFVVMRNRILCEFDCLWFDCMNGDSRETGKLTPDGTPDPSVFSTEHNREGIRVGTAVCVVVRNAKREPIPTVRFRQFWGVTKRQDVLDSLKARPFNASYSIAKPDRENRFSFRPEDVSAAYNSWPRLTELCAVAPSNGLMEKRGGALIDIDRDALERRMRDYFDVNLSWEDYASRHDALVSPQAGFFPPAARKRAIAAEHFNKDRLVRYSLRPLEARWCYYTQVSPVWNRARPTLWSQCFEGNAFLVARPAGVSEPEGVPLYFTTLLGDNDFQRGHSYYFPLRVAPQDGPIEAQTSAFEDGERMPNLSERASAYLDQLRHAGDRSEPFESEAIWLHALAIGYSPAYLTENADGLRRDWPRIPLPSLRKTLERSAELGSDIAALLNTEAEVQGVTSGNVENMFKTFGLLTKVGGGALNPDAGDLAITAGWGHAGKEGVTMPGKGRVVERAYTDSELETVYEAAKARRLSQKTVFDVLGPVTLDVYLNDRAYWRNVPVNVWRYFIGGYQVVKKWLSYREQELLGRPLKREEAREVTAMVRRLAGIVLLQPALDENYRRVVENTYEWKK